MGTTVDTSWKPWLPPRKIRDRGDLEFKVGQIWAWRFNDDPIVFRVLAYGRGKDASVRVEGLARRSKWDTPPMEMRAAGNYVLVQDVGQPEPTPPDTLWQEAYALPPDICYADACTSVRVMGRDDHGKAYCWKHRALWGTVTREVSNEQTMANMGRALAASMDKSMMDAFQAAGLFLNEGPGADRRTRLEVGDTVWMNNKDGLVLPACDGRPGCACKRTRVGTAVGRKGDNLIAAVYGSGGEFEFKVGPGLSLDDLPDYAARPAKSYATVEDLPGDMVERAEKFTYSNLLAPMKPITADSILEVMKSIDAIKTRDAETKKRYDDIVMSGFTAPHPLSALPPPVIPHHFRYDFGSPNWRAPILMDDMSPARPIPKSEKEIYQLQKLNDGDRKRVELFPVIREGAPRTQSQSIAAGLGVWSTRGDAKLPLDPKPYPHVSDEDLLPDAGR